MPNQIMPQTKFSRRTLLKALGLGSVVALTGTAATIADAAGARVGAGDLQELIDAAFKSGARTLSIPARTYVVDRPLTINGSNLSITAAPGASIALSGDDVAVISLQNCSAVKLSGFQIAASGAREAAIIMNRCKATTLSDLKIGKIKKAGVLVTDSTSCTIEHCSFTEAMIDDRWQQPSASDIAIMTSNEEITVAHNVHRSGGAYAVQIRTNKSGETSRSHVITNEDIDGYNSYGIMLYRNGPYFPGDVQILEKVTIKDNHIANITGNRSADPSKRAVLDFGSGIYMQGAEDCTVTDNTVSNTNQATSTELLAPGAIGLANVGACQIGGNTISASNYGIYINDALHKGNPNGRIAASKNIFKNIKKNPIKVVAKSNVDAEDNSYSGCGQPFVATSTSHGQGAVENLKTERNVQRD